MKRLLLLLLSMASALQADVTIRFTAPTTGWTARYVIVQANYPAYDAYGQEVVGGFGQTVYLGPGQSHNRTVGMRFVGANRTLTPTWKEDYGGSPVNATAPASVNPPVDGQTYEFTLGPAGPAINSASFTNNTGQTMVLAYEDGATKGTVTLLPGDSLNVATTNALTIGTVTAFIQGAGEFATVGYKTNNFVSYATPSSSSSNTVPPPAPPTYASATNSPVFNAPANDAQKAANATVNEIRSQAASDAAANAALLAELQKLNKNQFATNRGIFDNTSSNAVHGQGASVANSASNSVAGSFSGSASNSIISGITSMNGVGAGSVQSMSFALGGVTYNFNPFSNSQLEFVAAFTNKGILWVAKILLIVAMFHHTVACWKALAKNASGTSTSGWLQAFPISLAQAGSTFAGLTGRWVTVGFAVAIIGGAGAAVLTLFLPSFSLATVVAAGGSPASVAWSWVQVIVPVDDLLACLGVYVATSIGMVGVTAAAAAASDATGKL